MAKTLHKNTTEKSLRLSFPQPFLHGFDGHDEVLANLMSQMKDYLHLAANNTLSPRPQAIIALLKKASS